MFGYRLPATDYRLLTVWRGRQFSAFDDERKDNWLQADLVRLEPDPTNDVQLLATDYRLLTG